MKVLYIPFLFFLLSCTSSAKEEIRYAEKVNYYYQITQEEHGEKVETKLTQRVEELLPGKQYGITNKSGTAWPFFEGFEPEEKVAINDLMTPHVITHQYFPLHEVEFKDGDERLDVTILNKEDTYSFDMIIYKRENGKWVEHVNTGNHKIAKSMYQSEDGLIGVLSKTIIRFSFK